MDIMRIDLNLLAAFEVLMHERNVTKAADRLCLSQPAVSAALGRLRDALRSSSAPGGASGRPRGRSSWSGQ
jgi:hypothetical protein